MKRRSNEIIAAGEGSPESKKQRLDTVVEEEAVVDLGEDLVFEVLKRADARTLGRAACVSRRWREMAEDERLWEAVCTPHWAGMSCGEQQLRSVVLALGGFRRLHSLYMVPLQPSASRLPLASSRLWRKDEVQLSLSVISIGIFQKMSNGFRPGTTTGNCSLTAGVSQMVILMDILEKISRCGI